MAAPVRVLAFVEARGITGALRILLDFATASPDAVRFELATYWRSAQPGVAGPATDGIQRAIDAAAARGIPTHIVHERFAGDPRLIPQVRDLLRRTDADIIETHHVKSHALVAASGVPLGQRWIAFHHGYTTTSLKTQALNYLDRWSLTRPAAIVTPCRAFAHDLSRQGVDRAKINVIPSAVRVPAHATFIDVRARLGLRGEDRVVLAVGRLSHEKAHAVLIDAFARAPLSAARGAALVIVGDGPERERLAARAKRLGVSCVHLIGHQADVWPYYAAADAVALPSDSEGSPNALLEAMAAAKPIVATSVGGVPDMIEHGRDGLLVPPRNPDALSAALAAILQDPELAYALGERARHRVRERFTVELRAKALTTVYQRLCRA